MFFRHTFLCDPQVSLLSVTKINHLYFQRLPVLQRGRYSVCHSFRYCFFHIDRDDGGTGEEVGKVDGFFLAVLQNLQFGIGLFIFWPVVIIARD